MSDKFHNDLGSNEKMFFQLFDDDSLIHEETYYISGGKCHMFKNFGKDTIIVSK